MYIKRLDNSRFMIPTGKGIPTFIARTREPIPEQFSTVTIIKRKQHYFACFIVEIPEAPIEDNGEILAIDLGIKTLCTGYSTYDEFVIVPKFSHYTKHLDYLRSQRDRKQKGSRRWKKWDRIFQRQLDKYLNRVDDYLHKASYFLIAVRSESTIVVGDLNLETMKTDRSWFNRICQNEWRVGRFVEFLDYKSQKYGKQLVKIDERNTTKTCSCCGRIHKLSLSDRVYRCECGHVMDRDMNSARNILQKYTGTASAGVMNSKLRSDDLSNLNVVKFVYV